MAALAIKKRVGNMDILEKKLLSAEKKLMRIRLGVFVRIAACGEAVDADPFDLAVKKILCAIVRHVGPPSKKRFGVPAHITPSGLDEDEDSFRDEGFVLAKIPGADWV